MRKKIMLYFIILIITGMSVTGFFVVQQARDRYKNDVRERIETVALLFDNELSRMVQAGTQPDYNALAKTYSDTLSSDPRITVIDNLGNVLGESQSDYSSMENHLDRHEVQEALKGGIGEDIRFSDTMKMDFLYIAVPSSQTDMIIRVSVPLDQLRRSDLHILLYSLAGMLAGLLLTSLLALRFSSDISKPLKNLTLAAKEIEDGNYSKRVDVNKQDEFGLLATAFNHMAFTLDKTVADLTDKNIQFDAILNSMTNCVVAVDRELRVVLINAVAEQLFGITKENALGRKLLEVIRNRQINEIMEKTVDSNTSVVTELTMGAPDAGTFSIHASPIRSLEGEDPNSGAIISILDITTMKKLEKIRTEFVSNVTHELKTPLTSIRGFVETLRNGAVNDPEVAPKFLEIIDIEAERLTMLINDILQLSEIENSARDTNITRHNMTETISEVVSVLQIPAEKKGVSLNLSAAPVIMIEANRDRIKQMLINLIDNGINYNRENGSVNIDAAKADGKVVICIEDTGIGIDPEHHDRIFERFYRVDKGRSRSMGGTGLGLSIVKHIVNMYNGDIMLYSELGKGTKFTIQLPVSAP